MDKNLFDLVIVGAGPAGISCALAAKKKNLKTIMLDKGNIVNSIINFPKNMTFFSTADLLELDNIPLISELYKPNRKEVIRYYQRIVSSYNLQIKIEAKVTNIESINNGFKIVYLKKNNKYYLYSKYIVLATGFFDNPNMLNIPGENLSHVSHYYDEPFQYYGKKVIIVGGKNSAFEAALDLYRSGVEVTLIHRKKEIRESVKYWILPDIKNRIKSGEIKAYLNSELKKIKPDSVVIKKNKKEILIPADGVLLLTGYHPNCDLLKNSQIIFNKETLVPKYNKESLESNVSGIYLAGSLIAGKNSNKIFIENSREHGTKIINHILISV
jgi:putative YpdA family bacillithiol system oxidoreductase